jgi:uncharacterized protein (DUF302 family)
MIKPDRILRIVLLPFLLIVNAWAYAADDVQQSEGAYFIDLPASANFKQVVERVQEEIAAHNWEVMQTVDIDEGLKKNYQMDIQNKLVYACKSQYLAQAIKEDPHITLLVPCRFAIYRVGPTGEAVAPRGDDCRGGKIVVGVADPVNEAKALGIQQREAATAAGRELQQILQAVADAFKRDAAGGTGAPQRQSVAPCAPAAL